MNCIKSFITSAFLVSILTFSSLIVYAQEAKKEEGSGAGSATTAHMYGEFALTTNYIYQGISESNGSFAMQPEAGYLFPRAKIGLWGSNVQYPTNTESLNLRPFVWYDIAFTSNIDLKFKYDMSMYFRANDRNANIIRLDFNYTGHHVIVENNSNWFGTGKPSYWLAYGHQMKAFWDVDFKFEGGMQYMSSPAYSTYIAAMAGLGYKYVDIYYDLMFSYNMNSGQFANGIADPSIYLKLTAKF